MSDAPNFRKAKKNAEETLRLAAKVIAYRKDIFGPKVEDQIIDLAEELSAEMKDAAGSPERIHAKTLELDVILKQHGSTHYPQTFWAENIETLLVASILAIGIRTFFLQPFQIPTNSMYPTYAGMLPVAYENHESPSLPERAFRRALFGAKHYDIDAPEAGEVEVLVHANKSAFNNVLAKPAAFPNMGRKWFGLMPDPKWSYFIRINETVMEIEVPAQFNLDELMAGAFLETKGQTAFSEAMLQSLQSRKLPRSFQPDSRELQSWKNYYASEEGLDTVWLRTGKMVEEGESVLTFDRMAGDMLFVDRFSYHFVKPDIGDPFVFRTDEIPGLRDAAGNPDDKYYIKRLVGKGGDTLEIRGTGLVRNGEPIEGKSVFGKMADQSDGYPGYESRGHLMPGSTDTIPEGYYYAMGDNSPHSYDSRLWGLELQTRMPSALAAETAVNFVPEKAVVGKALFIFYPFTSRWGVAE